MGGCIILLPCLFPIGYFMTRTSVSRTLPLRFANTKSRKDSRRVISLWIPAALLRLILLNEHRSWQKVQAILTLGLSMITKAKSSSSPSSIWYISRAWFCFDEFTLVITNHWYSYHLEVSLNRNKSTVGSSGALIAAPYESLTPPSCSSSMKQSPTFSWESPAQQTR